MTTRRSAIGALRAKSWSPFVVGAAIGLLSWFAFATADHGLGITTAFEHSAALAQRAVSPEAAASNSYYTKESPKIGWEWMLVVGVFLGSFISSKLSGDRPASDRAGGPGHAVIPPVWRARFGDSTALRLAAAFAGGLIMMMGARLARGCTSGHGITGALQLAVSSWAFILLAFACAVVVALLLFGRPSTRGVE